MWKLIQYSRQGRGHLKNDVPCQDMTFVLQSDSVSVIALADGAGSARMSHFGARKVTEEICKLLVTSFSDFINEENPNIVRSILYDCWIQALKSLSELKECDIKELASTVLAVAVSDDEYFILHIGDGVIGYVVDNEVKVASGPDNGEFCNSTIFTTSLNASRSIRLLKGKLNNISGFVLFSDGIEATLYNHSTKSIDKNFVNLFEDLKLMSKKKVKELMNELFDEFISHTIDDCSMALMVNIPEDTVNAITEAEVTIEEKPQAKESDEETVKENDDVPISSDQSLEDTINEETAIEDCSIGQKPEEENPLSVPPVVIPEFRGTDAVDNNPKNDIAKEGPSTEETIKPKPDISDVNNDEDPTSSSPTLLDGTNRIKPYRNNWLTLLLTIFDLLLIIVYVILKFKLYGS